MSQGYKERCLLTDNAVAMWSFDGDQYDRAAYLPLQTSIIDEVDNQSPAQIQHETPTVPWFTIGRPSLVELEQSNQYSGIFGGSGPIVGLPQSWPKTYLTVGHTSAFSFPQRGSFSVELIFRKDSESQWITWKNNYYVSKRSPVIRKTGVFDINTNFGYGETYIQIVGPLATQTIQQSTLDFTAVNVHLVLTWTVEQIAEFEFRGTQRVYANNRLLASSSRQYFDNTYPNTNLSVPIEIGGYSTVPSGSTEHGDRNGSRLYIDQVSIYGYGLTHDQVSTHYKKIFSYRNMVINEKPDFFWDMADTDSANGISADIGGKNGTLYGSYTKGVSGPTKLPTTSAVLFNTSGWMWVPNIGYYGTLDPLKSISGDYTFEFWFSSGATEPGTLLAMQGLTANFDGWLMEINVGNNQHRQGSIQFSERRGVYCFSDGAYNDSEWHHIAVRRSGSTITMFIDGSAAATTTASPTTLDDPGQLIVFSNGPRSFAGPGRMCYLAIYGYAMQDAQIACRSTYQVGYEIKGIVTLQGNPVQATLRFYYSNTGELIKEIDSDLETGEYRIELYNNRNVDILVFDKYNKNVRYRAYGPVAPSGYEDFPITL